ncbi:MAG: histone deacetylase [Myxococcales bacterium]|nr:histone deacetylase [Myxococcales bacterium]
MQIFATDTFVLPLPPRHRFPMAKYARLRARVEAERAALGAELRIPDAATDDQLALAHDPAYIRRVAEGGLDPREIRAIGFPWSPALVERSRRSAGATIAAARAALAEGCGVNLAGGTHHAFAGRGEGFCVFNDAAVAARAMQAEGRIRRAIVVDCDVHQGNGTASILADDPTIFTLSLHGAGNFPFTKERSDLDVALADGCGDEAYLEALDDALTRALPAAAADLAIYLAGADPYVGDALGRLALTKAGLARRDALVLGRCATAGVPVAVAMAGGYAPAIDDIVEIHLESVRLAAAHAPRLAAAAAARR